MTGTPPLADHIRRTLVGLKMPRAIEVLDATIRRLERGEMTALEAIDALLAEELTLRESRRIKTALVMARLSAIKTLGPSSTSPSSLPWIEAASWRWPSSASSTAARRCTSSVRPVPAKATSRSPSALRR
jgi:hypothetical protein